MRLPSAMCCCGPRGTSVSQTLSVQSPSLALSLVNVSERRWGHCTMPTVLSLQLQPSAEGTVLAACLWEEDWISLGLRDRLGKSDAFSD
jgi:hypothetical protein